MSFDPHDKSRFDGFNIINRPYKTVQGHVIDVDILYSKNLKPSSIQSRSAPVFLRFHGGGLVCASSLFPPFFAPWILQLAERHSAIIVSPNYRLVPEATVQDLLDDAGDAFEWVRNCLPSLMQQETGIHVDVNRILTGGDSAGGYISLQLGLNHPHLIKSVLLTYPMLDMEAPHYIGEFYKPIFNNLPMVPKDVVLRHLETLNTSATRPVVSSDPLCERGQLLFGYIQHGILGEVFPPDKRHYLPLRRIEDGARLPSGGVLVWHGKDDTVVPLEGSYKLQTVIEKLARQVSFNLVVRDGEHGFDKDTCIDDDWASESLKPLVDAWLS